MSLAIDTVAMKKEGKIDYVISIRDIALFCRVYRAYKKLVLTDTDDTLNRTLRTAILMKFSDYDDRQVVRARISDVFGVNIWKTDYKMI